MIQRRPFFITFLAPAVVTAVILAAALFEVLQYSVREFVPGSLNVGGFTLDNFTRINRPIYWWVLLDTFYISLLTAVFSLLLSYPVAFALVRAKRDWVRSLLVSLSITPLFTGEIVRTFSWMLMLGSDGFINSMLRKLSLIDMPLQIMYTRLGVVVALVQFSMPVMIILLATAISHVDRDCEKAAANLGASPGAVFWRITLPLTLPGILSGIVVVFAWTMSAFFHPAADRRRQGADDLQPRLSPGLLGAEPALRRDAEPDRADRRARQPRADEIPDRPPRKKRLAIG
ncbi:ABC transporter permease [Ancylobacter dichloromethanicus]